MKIFYLSSCRKIVFFALVVILFTSCGDDNSVSVIDRDLTIVDQISVPDGFVVELYEDNLNLPTSIAFPPDGSDRLFVNELQSGQVKIIEDGELLPDPFIDITTNVDGGFPVDGENGLLGITFDPDYPSNPYVYVTYAVRTDTGTFGAVARITDDNNTGTDFTVLLDGLPSAQGHQVESLRFGPDDKLYVSVGDAYNEAMAQDTTAFHGKILRMNRDGSIPADNPFPGSYTYALGFRNCFDFVFRDNGELLTTENGPSHNDEFNVVLPGNNYGWPDALGESNNPDFTDPIYIWQQVVSPTGMLYYNGNQFPEQYRGKLFLVLFGDTYSSGPSDIAKRIQVATITGTGLNTQISFEDFAVYEFGDIGNPVDIAVGPDGNMFLTDIFRGTIYRIRTE